MIHQSFAPMSRVGCARVLTLLFWLVLVLAPILPARGQGTGYGGSHYCPCLLNVSGEGVHDGDPVELWRGALEWSQTDLAVGGPVPMHLRRHHCTMDYTPGPFGSGTSMDHDYFIVQRYQGYEVVGPRNRRYVFTSPVYNDTGEILYWTDPVDPEFAGCRLVMGEGLSAQLRFPDGTTWYFNQNGALVATRDRLGVGLDFTRNTNGYLTRIANSLNTYAIEISYGPEGLVSSVSDVPLGRTVSYQYDGQGRLSQVTDLSGGVTTYEWIQLDYLRGTMQAIQSVVDPRGMVILSNGYDDQGRVSSQWLGNAGTYRFEYLPQPDGSQITRVTDPDGNVTSYHFDPVGEYRYRARTITNPLGRTTAFQYASGVSFLTAVTDFRGRTVELDWDANGNLLAVHRPTLTGGTATTSFTYDQTFNELTSATDELGQTATITLNAQGLPTSVRSPAGQVAQFAYNAAGQVTQFVDPAGAPTTINYNFAGQPASVTDALNRTVSFVYDGAGRLQQITDPLQRNVTLGVTPSTRLAAVTLPGGVGYSVTYGAANLPTRLDVNGGGTYRWTYDGAGHTTSGTDPAGATETVSRTASGLPLVITDRKGQRVEVRYGPGKRVEQVVYRRADGTIESTVTYSYDPNTDLLVSIDDTAGPDYSFTYNALDQLTSITGPEGVTTYQYVSLGRPTAVHVPGLPAVTYTYDAFGRLASVSQGAETVSYAYDSAGRLATVTRPNGVVTYYSYDLLSRISRIEHRYGNTLLEYEAYTRDAGGRITARERNGVLSSFNYNDLDELIGHTIPGQTASFTYDATGNRISETVDSVVTNYTYGAGDRLAAAGDLQVVHDANGSIVRYGSAILTWDVRGRLTRIEDGGNVTTFAYDVFNRRVAKTHNGVTRRYVYLGHDLAVEADANGNVLATYFYEPGIDLPVSRTDANGTIYYLHDLAGSITALTRPDGSLIGRYHYTPWGEVAADPGMPAQPLLWTARELDETGLYYLRARYYLPRIGRFLSEDPAGLAAGLNLYVFAHNRPVGARDPFGLDASNLDDGDPAEYEPPERWGDVLIDNANRRPWVRPALVGMQTTAEVVGACLPGSDWIEAGGELTQGNFGLAIVAVLPGPDLGKVWRIGRRLPPIVIGENMKDRVIPYAREIGATWYKPRPGVPPDRWLKNNERAVKRWMREGREIIDIGIDPRRSRRSPYYEMEKRVLEEAGYPITRVEVR